MSTEHKWKESPTDIGTEECEECGTRIYRTGGVWQRRKGAHWRRIAREQVQQCKTKKETTK